MTREAMRVREMFASVRSKLRADLNLMAEEVLQQPFVASQNGVPPNKDVADLDLERLRTELALRTMASRYALLNRMEKALKSDGDVLCDSDLHDNVTTVPCHREPCLAGTSTQHNAGQPKDPWE